MGKTDRDFRKAYYDDFVLGMSEANTARTRQRVDVILRLIGDRRGRLLTIGAGNLEEPLAFRKAGFDVSIVDIADTQFDRARKLGIEPFQANVEKEEIPGRYDVVCCLEVLEHLVDPLSALLRLKDVIGADGRIFVSLPEEFHLVARMQILFGKPPFSRYDWPHLRFFNLRSAEDLIRKAGLDIVTVRHISLVPPRWPPVLQGVGKGLCSLFPSLFSLSHLFELRGV